MKKNLKGFTLVEVLIVIIIVGILIAALLPRLGATQGRARDLNRNVGISQAAGALELLIRDVGAINTSGTIVCLNSTTVGTITAGTNSVPLSTYLATVPSDPNSTDVDQAFDAADQPTCAAGEYAVMIGAGGTSARVVGVAESRASATFTNAFSNAQLSAAPTEAEISTGGTNGTSGVFVLASRVITD